MEANLVVNLKQTVYTLEFAIKNPKELFCGMLADLIRIRRLAWWLFFEKHFHKILSDIREILVGGPATAIDFGHLDFYQHSEYKEFCRNRPLIYPDEQHQDRTKNPCCLITKQYQKGVDVSDKQMQNINKSITLDGLNGITPLFIKI
jgi:hypothetical protein